VRGFRKHYEIEVYRDGEWTERGKIALDAAAGAIGVCKNDGSAHAPPRRRQGPTSLSPAANVQKEKTRRERQQHTPPYSVPIPSISDTYLSIIQRRSQSSNFAANLEEQIAGSGNVHNPGQGWQNRNIRGFAWPANHDNDRQTVYQPSTANRELIGRQAGSVAGFHYTADHKKLSVTWDAATLEKYLANPRTMVPDTSMVDAGLKHDAKRA
jgi:hypothetical protein